MNRRKLKSFVIPSIYVSALLIVFITIVMIGNLNTVIPENNLDYSVDSLDSTEIPVISEVEEKSIKPYTSEKVLISKNFYSKDDEESLQKESLILFQDTYLQNTGILYTSEEVFDIVSVLQGTIKNVTTDELLGVVVEIAHENNITSYYYSLSEVFVKVGDIVETGQIIGKSGDNKIENKSGSSLLFEVYHIGKAINPEIFYNTNIKDYK